MAEGVQSEGEVRPGNQADHSTSHWPTRHMLDEERVRMSSQHSK